jgi:hypothetical protein
VTIWTLKTVISFSIVLFVGSNVSMADAQEAKPTDPICSQQPPVPIDCRPTLDCTPQRDCSACLAKNPFGGCIVRGNDPTCEAAKSSQKVACEVQKAQMKASCEAAKALIEAKWRDLQRSCGRS